MPTRSSWSRDRVISILRRLFSTHRFKFLWLADAYTARPAKILDSRRCQWDRLAAALLSAPDKVVLLLRRHAETFICNHEVEEIVTWELRR